VARFKPSRNYDSHGEKNPQSIFVPLVTDDAADLLGLRHALVVPAVCYFTILGFGWFARRPLQQRKMLGSNGSRGGGASRVQPKTGEYQNLARTPSW
jgi:hypothetical protein